MNVIWIMTNAVIAYCAGSVGSSVGAAVYESAKNIVDYIWINPEEGYLKDFPEDEEKETNLGTVIKRLGVIMGK